MTTTKTPGAKATGEAAALPGHTSAQMSDKSAQGANRKGQNASFKLNTSDLPRLMDGLLDRAKESLTDEDLERLMGQAERAEHLMGHLAAFTNGLACMVTSDARDAGMGSGAFKAGPDLSELLFCISALAEQAGTLAAVAGWAQGQSLLRAHTQRHGISALSDFQGELQ